MNDRGGIGMITWIGLCAGEIWNFLDHNNGKATLGKILSSVRAPKDTIYMALGWLAREGYVSIDNLSLDTVVSLNRN